MNHTNHADSTFKSELSKIATSATSPSNMESTSSESNSMIERISRSQSQICLHQRVHGWRQLNFWSVCWLTPNPRPPSKIPTRSANQYVRSLHSRMNPITFWFLSRSLLSTLHFAHVVLLKTCTTLLTKDTSTTDHTYDHAFPSTIFLRPNSLGTTPISDTLLVVQPRENLRRSTTAACKLSLRIFF